MKIMGFRAKSMQALLENWSKGNFKYLIQQLRSYFFQNNLESIFMLYLMH
jgi:hypothetical protein